MDAVLFGDNIWETETPVERYSQNSLPCYIFHQYMFSLVETHVNYNEIYWVRNVQCSALLQSLGHLWINILKWALYLWDEMQRQQNLLIQEFIEGFNHEIPFIKFTASFYYVWVWWSDLRFSSNLNQKTHSLNLDPHKRYLDNSWISNKIVDTWGM